MRRHEVGRRHGLRIDMDTGPLDEPDPSAASVGASGSAASGERMEMRHAADVAQRAWT
jgi:hypothetical protein